MTVEQIKAIQEGGFDWHGQPLNVDGVWGPKTAWWAGIKSQPWQRQSIVVTMAGYYRDKKGEDPGRPNRGLWVDKVVEPGGIGFGHPWCIALTSHVMRMFYEPSEWPYHMSTLKLIEWARKEGRIVKDPKPGDIACFMRTSTEGHGEFVFASNQNWVLDCGGNIGNKVQVGKRARDGLTFIRTIDDEVSLSCPPLEGMLNLDGTGTR